MKIKIISRLYLFSFFFILLFSCKTTSVSRSRNASAIFTLGFNKEEKSDILTQKGIEIYKEELGKKLDYKQVPVVRAFFITAIYLNRENGQAINYLKKNK
jgi:hypothetical protein